MPVTVTTADNDIVGHYRTQRFKFVRDSGAAMAAPFKVARIFSYFRLTKTDGTYVDTRNETPAGLTIATSAGITSLTIDNTLLPASETVFLDCFMGSPAGVPI